MNKDFSPAAAHFTFLADAARTYPPGHGYEYGIEHEFLGYYLKYPEHG